jgi:hypothetical protein
VTGGILIDRPVDVVFDAVADERDAPGVRVPAVP